MSNRSTTKPEHERKIGGSVKMEKVAKKILEELNEMIFRSMHID